MSLRASLTITSGKLWLALLKLQGKDWTYRLGSIALKFCPCVLSHLAKGMPVILITGTNGNTTTARMAAKMLSDSNVPFLTNNAGANTLNGVVTVLLGRFPLCKG